MIYDDVARIIGRHAESKVSGLGADVNLIDGLGIDSLDFLDIAYEIDRHYGIKLPLERWVEKINAGEATTDDYFVMSKLCAAISDLISSKSSC